jgi:hypothetical protein
MLLIVLVSLAAAWAAVLAVVMAACVSAGRADRDLLTVTRPRTRRFAPATERLQRSA